MLNVRKSSLSLQIIARDKSLPQEQLPPSTITLGPDLNISCFLCCYIISEIATTQQRIMLILELVLLDSLDPSIGPRIRATM